MQMNGEYIERKKAHFYRLLMSWHLEMAAFRAAILKTYNHNIIDNNKVILRYYNMVFLQRIFSQANHSSLIITTSFSVINL